MLILLIFLLHCLAAFALTGMVLFLQVVGYPFLRSLPAETFTEVLRDSVRKTTWLMGAGMMLDAATGLFLLTLPNWRESIFSLNLLLLLGCWLSIFLLQAPLFRKLMTGKDEETIKKIPLASWVSTSAYIGRCLILILVSLPNG